MTTTFPRGGLDGVLGGKGPLARGTMLKNVQNVAGKWVLREYTEMVEDKKEIQEIIKLPGSRIQLQHGEKGYHEEYIPPQRSEKFTGRTW